MLIEYKNFFERKINVGYGTRISNQGGVQLYLDYVTKGTETGVKITYKARNDRANKIRTWANYTQFNVGDYVEPTTDTGYVYRCTSAGRTGLIEPNADYANAWPVVVGNTVVDGGITWICVDPNFLYYQISERDPLTNVVKDLVIKQQDAKRREIPLPFGETTQFMIVDIDWDGAPDGTSHVIAYIVPNSVIG